MALVDLETEVKPYLEIPASDTSSDDLLSLLMEAATDFFESWTDRELEEQSHTHQFNGNGEHTLRLREFPIIDLSYVSIDDTWQFLTPIPTSELLVDNELWVVRREVWPQGVRNIQVSYSADYAADDVPIDLRQACLMMVEYLYHGRSDHRLGVTTRTKVSESLTFDPDIPKPVLTLLAPYHRKAAVEALVRRQGG